MYTWRGPLTMISVTESSRSKRLHGPEADDLVRDLLEHANTLGASEGQALLVDDAAKISSIWRRTSTWLARSSLGSRSWMTRDWIRNLTSRRDSRTGA